MPIDPDAVSSNPSDNPSFDSIVDARYSRRAAISGGLAAAALTFVGSAGLNALTATPASALGRDDHDDDHGHGRSLLGFASVAASSADVFTVPDGYTAEVLIPWGQPLLSSGPAWKKDASNTAAEQAQQVGAHHDGMHFFPISGRRDRGLLVVNHEYIDTTLHYTDGSAVMTQEKVDKALAGHGVTVILVGLQNGTWKAIDSPLNRRITGTTPMAFSGPLTAEHAAMVANNAPMGTLNNCANGSTPWGTYLTCEENWNGYFGTTDPTFVPTANEARYGLNASGFGYQWHLADPRFDIAVNRNEPNRFGWVVEIDPFNATSTPVKRSALGRIKHEGALVTEARGQVVVYMGDDQDKEYIYKFIGSGSWQKHRARGRSPFDVGTLYVARFDEDGSGTWLPLVFGQGPLTAANGWVDQADVLLRTRAAADAVGATKMDRPEWIARNPKTGELYATLTNGSSGPSAPNPRKPNPYGHIIRWRESSGVSTSFEWDIFVLAGDPAYDPQVNIDGDIFGSPDGLWFDPSGRLWIQTDISNSSQLRADRGYDHIGNNQMLAADPSTGEIRRFLVGPRGAEITGVTASADQQTMFVNVQHPGESTTSIGSPTPADPRVVSNWPDFDPEGRPRSATVVIRKVGGGKIGS